MIVKNVKFINDKVEIVFENNSFFMSKENYIENPLSIDSHVSEDKLLFLIEQEKIIEVKIKVIKLLNKKCLTELEVKKILKENNLGNKDIEKIIDGLKGAGLINDEYTAMLLVESLLVKKKGKLEIAKFLKEKGIDYKIVNKLIEEIDEGVYLNNFHKIYEKYLKMYDNRASKVKKQMIVNKLKEYGYEEYLINEIKIEKNYDEEMELARINLKKIIKNKKLDLRDYENINKIKVKLAMKGFNYDIINLVLEEAVNDETY